MKFDLTIAKIKNIEFNNLYDDFIIGKDLCREKCEALLALAVCFINAKDKNVQKLGYRIIVEYCNRYNDYMPLYEIAINMGLYPISKFIDLHYMDNEKKNFFTSWNDAFTEQYAKRNIYQTEQQRTLDEFFANHIEGTVSIVAPTSYGKSDLIENVIRQFSGRNICILTSTKSLLMQTKRRIQDAAKGLFPKIIVHPEMYNIGDNPCLAVLTQERLLRLLKKDKSLSFDCVVVDEAHELFEDEERSQALASVLIIAQKRNKKTAFKFLTPFLVDSNNLRPRFMTMTISDYKVTEYVKSEKYYVYDIRNKSGLSLYDQFFNKLITVECEKEYGREEEFINDHSAGKNIIYINKPSDIEKFAISLSEILPDIKSDEIDNIVTDISNYINPDYRLLKCLKKGVVYHHGSVPDAIRVYIEDLYRRNEHVKYIVTSSTLLSGVNLPAERMFILGIKRGISNLKYDSFFNLVGRVCRFNDIFSKDVGTLKHLMPHIYFVFGRFFSSNTNLKDFLKNVANVEKKYSDKVENILLASTNANSRKNDYTKAIEFIENYENGVINNYRDRYIKNPVGQACVMNRVNEIDIFRHELAINQKLNNNIKSKINNADDLINAIANNFLTYLEPNVKEPLQHLLRPEARRFYAMMFSWRSENKSYAEMIAKFVGYWKSRGKKDPNALIFVGKWGDMPSPNGIFNYYTKVEGKPISELINLAIVRIKEEQDFIDNKLMKYVESLKDLSLLEEKFYSLVKYGTDDEEIICLIKNGLSLTSSSLLIRNYRKYFEINVENSTVSYDEKLLQAMKDAGENNILIHEIRHCI